MSMGMNLYILPVVGNRIHLSLHIGLPLLNAVSPSVSLLEP